MTAASPSPNGFERRRRRSRAALLDAAIELFQTRGVKATKLEEICELAGVSARTFFNHFETREHLYQAIALQRGSQLAALVATRSDSELPFDERLVALLDEIGAYVAGRPAYRELMREMLALRIDGDSDAAREIGASLLRFIETGVARGEVGDRHRPEILADLLLGAVTTSLAHWCEDGDYDLRTALAESARALLDLYSPRRRKA